MNTALESSSRFKMGHWDVKCGGSVAVLRMRGVVKFRTLGDFRNIQRKKCVCSRLKMGETMSKIKSGK